MPKDSPGVKHITMTCPQPKCFIKAFVQVLVVPEKELQPKIDARARQKLRKTLTRDHKEGAHDE